MNPLELTMLAGKMAGAYKVTPAEPVSNPSGMLTRTEPTAVIITVSRGAFSEDSFGYRLIAVGCPMVPVTGTVEEEGEADPEPQADSSTETSAAAIEE
jgi:hypothetical protein